MNQLRATLLDMPTRRALGPRATARLMLLCTAAVPTLALAHGGELPHDHGALAALAAGFAHPFTGLDHLLAMVSVGLWGALAARRPWVAPLAFAMALLAGATASLAGMALPAVEPVIAASVLALGLLVSLRWALPPAAAAALAAAFAFFHGAAHGTELSGALAPAARAGLVAATARLHASGLLAGGLLRERGRWMPRAAGAAVALVGVSMLVRLA